MKVLSMVFEVQMKDEKVREIIFNQTNGYDLILLEGSFSPGLAISHKFKVPTILISSFGLPFDTSEAMGIPTHPILYPTMARQRLYNLTIWEKLTELYKHYRLQNLSKYHEDENNEILKRIFGPNTPPINILRNYIDMLFLNVNPIWEGNHPVPPNVIYTGGLHQKPPKELPQELKQYLDTSAKGLIYFSFGTNVKPSLLPRHKILVFENVFSKLPYNIIWKWDSENIQAKSPNVKVLKWAPQSDLLRHPNVKAFITQGGLQSTDEAITAAVPLIGIPMLADQWYNVEKYVHHGIGVGLDFDTITEDKLMNAIVKVVEDKSYKKNIERLRSLMMDQPQQPLERAVWWIEYVIRHGGAKHLRAPGANISWAEYLEIDLIGLLLLGASIMIVLIYTITKLVITHVRIYLYKDKVKTR